MENYVGAYRFTQSTIFVDVLGGLPNGVFDQKSPTCYIWENIGLYQTPYLLLTAKNNNLYETINFYGLYVYLKN